MSARFPPIDGYAFLSDTHTAALVAPDGAVEWFRVPAFAGESVFARLLDRDRGGALGIEVAGAGAPERRYLGDTLVLESVHRTGDAAVTVTDFLAVAGDGDPAGPLAARHLLVRVVRAAGGTADVRIGIEPGPATRGRRPGGGRTATGRGCTRSPGCGPPPTGRCSAPAPSSGSRRRWDPVRGSPSCWGTRTRHGVPSASAGPTHCCARPVPRGSSRGDDIGTGRAHVRRSALVLRGLMYEESGALVAAPTTSPPETIGGERNWDYRYTWHRDAALTVLALFRLGHADEGVRYMRFLLHECVSGSGRLRPWPASGASRRGRRSSSTIWRGTRARGPAAPVRRPGEHALAGAGSRCLGDPRPAPPLRRLHGDDVGVPGPGRAAGRAAR
ncbi:glycoside hydrolase family 15 protein [Nonomuraea harbinensis]|uniref:Glycoside hydrolase family 15 protein n=1 Tax=Nonomuraea harbinensis TaxID=1286938 RepID=A0ABW1BZ67_9ACTN|nr:glycoside hydrolase family 15 protein [Nonomuraea harbinensis]